MYRTIIIVDDFLDNALEFRRAAMRLDYPSDHGGVFPGRNSAQRINIGGLSEEVSHLLGEPLKPIDPPMSHGKFRLTLASDVGKAKVHVDTAHWSGILYLSKPEDCRGGTEFFRHIRTNTDRAPTEPHQLAAHGYSSFEEMHADIIARDSMDDSAWEMTMQVPMRFNRLVLLRPWLWHTSGPGFGDSIENGRLIYVLFFQSAA
jgi:hypothetical protein